jgi:general secretion pathway protein C
VAGCGLPPQMSLVRSVARKSLVATMPLLLLAMTAFFVARSANHMFSLVVGGGDAQPPTRATLAPPPVNDALASMNGARAILRRNAFDHTAGSLDDPPSSAMARLDPDADPWGAPVCSGLRVVATVAMDDPQRSFAAIHVTGEPKALLRSRSQLAGAHTVRHVGSDRVWFSKDNALCQVLLFKQGDSPAASAVVSPTPPTTESQIGAAPASITKGILKTGDTTWDIDRATLDRIVESQVELLGTTRTAFEKEGGRVVGIRLSGIKSGALLGVLGMQNGDRLQTINGLNIGNIEEAMQVFARLRSAERLTVQVARQGKSINLDYTIK